MRCVRWEESRNLILGVSVEETRTATKEWSIWVMGQRGQASSTDRSSYSSNLAELRKATIGDSEIKHKKISSSKEKQRKHPYGLPPDHSPKAPQQEPTSNKEQRTTAMIKTILRKQPNCPHNQQIMLDMESPRRLSPNQTLPSQPSSFISSHVSMAVVSSLPKRAKPPKNYVNQKGTQRQLSIQKAIYSGSVVPSHRLINVPEYLIAPRILQILGLPAVLHSRNQVPPSADPKIPQHLPPSSPSPTPLLRSSLTSSTNQLHNLQIKR